MQTQHVLIKHGGRVMLSRISQANIRGLIYTCQTSANAIFMLLQLICKPESQQAQSWS